MANVSKPKEKAEEKTPVDPKAMRLYSVHLPEATKGPRRRMVDLGNRGKFLFNADVTGKENRKLAGYPHHRMKLTADEAAQFAGDGFKVRLLTDEEVAAAAAEKSTAAAALDQAAADLKQKAKE